MIIKTKNNLTDFAQKTYQTHLEVSGTNVLRWKNPNAFAASWAIQVGETGEEQTEIVLLNTSTPAGTAGTLTANTLYEHPADTPLYAIKYNQIVFERSTAGTAGTATPMTNGTVTIQADHEFTQFDDTSGSASYAYRSYFQNSVLAVTTTESDWLTPSGFIWYSQANLRSRIKGKLWSSAYVTDDEINDWINEYKEMMRNAAIAVNQDYALGTVDVAFDGTDGYGTITSTDFKDIRKMLITYNGGNDWYMAHKMNIKDYTPNTAYSSKDPFFAMRGDNVFQVRPDESGGTARITYYALEGPMDSDADELPVPMRGYTKGFIDYGLSQALGKDGKTVEAAKKENDAMTEIERFKSEISPRLKTGSEYIKISEAISGEDNWYF